MLDVEECLHLPERQWGVSYFPRQTASSEASLQNEFLMLNVMASLLQPATLLSWAYRFNARMSRVRTWGHSTQWELTPQQPYWCPLISKKLTLRSRKRKLKLYSVWNVLQTAWSTKQGMVSKFHQIVCVFTFSLFFSTVAVLTWMYFCDLPTFKKALLSARLTEYT